MKETRKHKLELGAFVCKCDECGGNIVVKEGKYGKFFACDKYPDCKKVLHYSEVKVLNDEQRNEDISKKQGEVVKGS